MGRVLYRKYRSKSLAEVIGQEHITETLSSALKNKKIAHAYLFSGPRGVGKTSVARILAHAVNDLKYTDDQIHLDIIEIDAASNRRIDEIRELRERVNIAPTSAKYKVYIIDEVHMLTKEAFNALLKTLEEPPAHCIFILATTEPHKLPQTIISRTQRFSFKPIGPSHAVAHLRDISKKEKIDIKPDALELLAEHGEGSFRDSLSLLDQLSNSQKTITAEVVRDLLGLPSEKLVSRVIDAVQAQKPEAVISGLDNLWQQGANPVLAAKQISAALRQRYVTTTSSSWLAKLLKNLIGVAPNPQPRDYLEIVLLEAAMRNDPGIDNPVSQIKQSQKPDSNADEPDKKLKQTEPIRRSSKPDIEAKAKSSKLPTQKFDLSSWGEVLTQVKKNHPSSLYSALRLAMPNLSEGAIILNFEFPLHHKKVNQAHNLASLSREIEALGGGKLKIECRVDKTKFAPRPKAQQPQEQPLTAVEQPAGPLSSISNIFGPVEMLES